MPSIEAAKRAMQYWAGAGLLVSDRGCAPAQNRNAESFRHRLTTLNDLMFGPMRGSADRIRQGTQPNRDAAAGQPVSE